MSKTYTIVALKGDGIGPEVTEATVKVLEAVKKNLISNLT
jgi:isocitrate/isopropylmalate dehydrogenase